MINWKEMEIPKDKTAQQMANAVSQQLLIELLWVEDCERHLGTWNRTGGPCPQEPTVICGGKTETHVVKHQDRRAQGAQAPAALGAA